jgi:archaellum component FlaD/FlaE
VEREMREEALKVEREEQESEKADAGKKYELLKNHLLDVEETTLDTIGWITNNVSRRLARFILMTELVKK